MPGPYSFTPARRAQFTYGGQHYDLPAGQPYQIPFSSSCQTLGFVLAAHQATTANSISNGTPRAFQGLQAECAGERNAQPSDVDNPDAPPTPPSNDNPAATGNDQPPPGGNETAQTLNAPAVTGDQNQVDPGTRDPGTSDGRPLSQQVYDQQNPMPDYDAASQLQEQGVPPGQVDQQLQSVMHNDAPDGQAHPNFSQNDQPASQTTLDPVIVHSGAFALDVTDVEIASVGMPLRLVRSYRSGTVSWGPWGYGWDHNYHVYLRELSDGSVAVWTGRFSEEVYKPAGAGAFDSPLGIFRKFERLPGLPAQPDRYKLTEAGGEARIFEVPTGWPLADRIPMTRVEDRHGNGHDLTYDTQGRLESVADPAGRSITFEYGDCGLLESVHDHSGRRWRYEHDYEVEHLVTVTTPPTSDYPDGVTTGYEYDVDQEHPALRHNLVRIVGGDGEEVVENEYGVDPMSLDFGRVVYQRFGEFEAAYSASELQVVPRTAEAINVPAIQVEVLDPGVLHVMTFNWRGDLLDERFRLVIDGSYRLIATISTYDEQGNLAERREPDGHGYAYEWDTAAVDPRARGNLLRANELASPLKPAPGRDVLRATYEPRYQLPKSQRDAEGELTEWIYDYELGPPGTGTGQLRELRHPEVTRPDGTTYRTIEHYEHNAAGQLTRHLLGPQEHRFEYFNAGAVRGYMSSRSHEANGCFQEEQLEYDDVGNLTARTDGTGNRTRYTVNALGQVEGTELPSGARWHFHHDGGGHLSRVEEPVGDAEAPGLSDPFIAHDFRYDVLGHVVAETRAANTSAARHFTYRTTAEGALTQATDALGRTLSQTVDERGQVIRDELRDAGGSLALARRHVYDRSGQLAKSVIEGGSTVEMDYDGFDQLKVVTAADGTELRYEHDQRGLQVEATIAGPGGFATEGLAKRTWERDERGMVRRQVEDVFTDPAGAHADAETLLWLDDEGRVERVQEPAGLVRERTYGPMGEILTEQDSLGNAWVWTYDAAGRQISATRTEASAAGPQVRNWTQFYDVDGRLEREEDPLGNASLIDYDERGMQVRLTNPLGHQLSRTFDAFDQIIEQTLGGATLKFERDAGDRVAAVQDPAGTVTGFAYDALDRLTLTERDDGLVQTRAFTPEGALKEMVDFDGTRLTFTVGSVGLPTHVDSTPAAGVDAIDPIDLDYDGLRRVTHAAAGGATHDFTYDSLGRLRRDDGPDPVLVNWDAAGLTRTLTYPDGRKDRAHFDELGRLQDVEHVSAGALALGFAPGDTLASLSWQGLKFPESVDLGSALHGEFEFDGAGRPTARRYDDGATDAYAECRLADGLGLRRTAWQKDPTEHGSVYNYDALARIDTVRLGLVGSDVPSSGAGLSQADIDAAVAAASAATANADVDIDYAPGATPAQRTDGDGAGGVISTRAFTENALHQLTSVDGNPVTYDEVGNLRQFGSRAFTYDAFRRLVQVDDGGATAMTVNYDGLGRVFERTDGGGNTERHSWLGDDLLQLTNGGGPLAQEVPGPGLDQPLMRTTASGTHLLALDATGNLMAACDPSGAVEERYRYDVFGRPEIFAANGSTPRASSSIGLEPRFGGRPWLADAGLYDFRARVYDPELLLFLQPDPYQFADSWCPYAFAGYNPTNFVDPFGMFWNIVAGAIIGAAIGGIGAALSGGDWRDVLVAAGAGAVGGAFAACGMPVLGGAIAGGIMGAWTGGRVGYRMGGAEGAVVGALVGGVAGGALGAAGGYLGSRIGNSVATGASGLIYGTLARNVASNTLRTGLARYGGQVIGGYVGGASASILTNNAAVIGVDIATGRPYTANQFWDATRHSLTIDGPLSAVGASAERFLWIRGMPGNTSNRYGAEGEGLVGRYLDVEPANGSQEFVINGRARRPDFNTNDTLPRYDAVVEVKNKAQLSQRDLAQLGDFEALATANGAELQVFERPGAGLSSNAPGLTNTRFRPIPQLPLVTTVPTQQLAGARK